MAKRKSKLPDAAVKILRDWLFAPENWESPYPSAEEKAKLLDKTGLNPKQLTNWLTNARKRLWAPLRQKQGAPKKNYAEAKRARQFDEWDRMTRASSDRHSTTPGTREDLLTPLVTAAAAAAEGAPAATFLAPLGVTQGLSDSQSHATRRKRGRAASAAGVNGSRDDDDMAPSDGTSGTIASSDPLAARVWSSTAPGDAAGLARAVASEAARASGDVGTLHGVGPMLRDGRGADAERHVVARLHADLEAQQQALQGKMEALASRRNALIQAMRRAGIEPSKTTQRPSIIHPPSSLTRPLSSISVPSGPNLTQHMYAPASTAMRGAAMAIPAASAAVGAAPVSYGAMHPPVGTSQYFTSQGTIGIPTLAMSGQISIPGPHQSPMPYGTAPLPPASHPQLLRPNQAHP